MIKDKIKKKGPLKKILYSLKSEGRRIVFTNGCFDILHLGHAAYLEEAKREGDILVVAVNSDSSTRSIKGAGRPIVVADDRMGLVASLESVDYVVLFDEETPESLIKELSPDVIVKGADWREEEIAGGAHVKAKGGRVVTIPLTEGRSTSSVIEKIKGL